MEADTAFFVCSSFQISLLDIQGEIFLGVRVTSRHAGVQSVLEKLGKRRSEQREDRKKTKQNVTAQLRAAAPDSQSYWESQHFLIIQDEQRRGEKKNLQQTKNP